MSLFFECTIKHPVESDDGKFKKFVYLVQADTYTEAEKDCYTIMSDIGHQEFSIEKIAKTAVNDVYFDNESEDARFYSVSASVMSCDDEGGVCDNYVYVIRSNDMEPVARYVKGLFNVDDVVITAQKRTNIVEFYSRDDIRDIESTANLTPIQPTENI